MRFIGCMAVAAIAIGIAFGLGFVKGHEGRPLATVLFDPGAAVVHLEANATGSGYTVTFEPAKLPGEK